METDAEHEPAHDLGPDSAPVGRPDPEQDMSSDAVADVALDVEEDSAADLWPDAEDLERGDADGGTRESTGHAGVDAVLGSLDRLEEGSVHDHVAVFETAHAGLRRALDAGDPDGGS